jgi:hypothetical protein
MTITKSTLRKALVDLWRKDDIELCRWQDKEGYQQVGTTEATDRLWQHMKEQAGEQEEEE